MTKLLLTVLSVYHGKPVNHPSVLIMYFFLFQSLPEKCSLFQAHTKQVGRILSYSVQNQKAKKK